MARQSQHDPCAQDPNSHTFLLKQGAANLTSLSTGRQTTQARRTGNHFRLQVAFWLLESTITEVLQSALLPHATFDSGGIGRKHRKQQRKSAADKGDRAMASIVKRDKTFSQSINWITTFFMVAFHIGAVAAFFFFSWKPVLVAVLLWWVAGSLGIGMGYHRLLTHRGYKTPKWVEYFLTTCGTLALEGGPMFW